MGRQPVRAQTSTAGTAFYFGQALVNGAIVDRRPAAVVFAMRLGQLTVHVQQPLGAGSFMQIIHILRA